MKKVRIIVNVSIVVLVIVVLVGVIIQISSPRPFTDITFDIIALVVSVSSVAIAVLSQISAYHDRRALSKMTHELNNIDSEVSNEMSADQHLHKKLDEIIKLDRRIYDQLSGSTPTSKKVKNS